MKNHLELTTLFPQRSPPGRGDTFAIENYGAFSGFNQFNNCAPPGLTGVVALAAGAYHSLALKQDGTVVAWGWNQSGQTNVPEGLTNVKAISAGGDFCVALKTDGTVVAWGTNEHGETNVPPDLKGVVGISAGGYHALAVKADGTVVSWGDNRQGQGMVPAGLNGIVAVAAGGDHSLALKSDGTVVGWGRNDLGQISIPPNVQGATAISAGASFSVALIGKVVEPARLALATAQIVNGFVVGINLTDGGANYLETPKVQIVGDGTGATATATMTDGVITGIEIVSPGSKYTSAQVIIDPPPFTSGLSIRVSKVAVKLNVLINAKYVLETSTDLKTWTATGAPFVAVNPTITQEFPVDEAGQFFRLTQVP